MEEASEIAGNVCTWCWFGSCRREDPGYATCGDPECTCGCEPYTEVGDEE